METNNSEPDDPLDGQDDPAPAGFDTDPVKLSRWGALRVAAQQWRHALACGDHARASKIQRESIAQLRGAASDRFADRPLGSLEVFTPRELNTLEQRLDVRTVGDLLKVPRSKFEATNGVGAAMRRSVLDKLAAASVVEIDRLESERAKAEGTS